MKKDRKGSNEEGQVILLPDGRHLGYLIVGEGMPVFWFHGFPSSRLEVLHLRNVAISKSLRFIGVDRPGIGLSTFSPKRRLRDFAEDVRYLADSLDIDKFALVGFSGGGPYVAICAAVLSGRVTKAMILNGISLPLERARIGKKSLEKERDRFCNMARDPEAFLKSETGGRMTTTQPEDDARFFSDPAMRPSLRIMLRSGVEAYRQGSTSIEARLNELRLMRKGWDVDLSKVPPSLIHIWHGTADRVVPVTNAYRNAEAIPNARLELFEGEGHGQIFLNHLEEIGEILSSPLKR